MLKKIRRSISALKYYLTYDKNIDTPIFNAEDGLCFLDICKDSLRMNKNVPKVVWMYWDHGNIPVYIQKIIQKFKKLNPEYNVKILSAGTLSEYLPNLIFSASDLNLANKSDIIRLELLYNYGGIWIDCTTIFYEDLSWLNSLIEKNKYDCIGYYREVSTIDYEFPVIESWFLCAPPKNRFIKEWLDILSPLKDMGSEQYFLMIASRSDFNIIKQEITTPEYLLVYLAEQIAMRNIKNNNFYLRKCESTAFLYQEYFEWDSIKMTTLLTQLNKPSDMPPLIKLTNYDRVYLDHLINLNLVRKNSIFYELLNQ
ncbi:glycosyltransferase family 32 protein [Acinetobacter nectaris]|uniref:glycosyltransferase family 32 protein n=1 Tax=Acinetobacter nectaris TaxID=1219382 RepID=UPI001F43BE4F|nr:hypothetical protein [Acinetobacter nectaris]